MQVLQQTLSKYRCQSPQSVNIITNWSNVCSGALQQIFNICLLELSIALSAILGVNKITLEQKISESSHTLERKGDRFTCISCLDSFTLKDPAFQHWLAGICMKAPEKCDRPVHINSNLHIGNANAHSSHRLRFFDGLVYCNRCGSSAVHHMRRLARPCRPPSTHGKLTIKYIREGHLPPV